ncbi:MAG: lysoplasmalogenase [Crocinitomicaceae bacterium]|nr:lysoplasmalogenase [Flavobacteriales bacterium]NQZ36782.1 lysoplasmalogenase [Crocinitomicaceae bacterium]
MEIPFLSIAVLLSAIIAIVYRQKENVKMYSVFKPLTTVLIIIIALIIFNETASVYSELMIVALLFSLIGDVFLISKKYFLPGLSSFLLAHICFTIGFASIYGFDWNAVSLVPLVIIAGVYYNFLRKDLKKYSIPVLVYMTVIVVMNWQAINLSISSGELVFLGIAFGSILFSFSDSILAYNKFKKPFKIAEILILASYWISIFTFTILGLYID